MLESETLIGNFTSLLGQVHRLRATLRVVVRTFLIFKEGIVALDGGIDQGDFLVVSITRGLGRNNLRGHVKHKNGLCLFDDDVDIKVELSSRQTLLGTFGGFFSLLALGLLILRGFDKRAR